MVHGHDEAVGQQLADEDVDFLPRGRRIMSPRNCLKDVGARQACSEQGPEFAGTLVKRIIIAFFEIHDDRLAINDVGDDRRFVNCESLPI